MSEYIATGGRPLHASFPATASVPSSSDLLSLREAGYPLGYRGIHIYNRYSAILEVLAQLPPVTRVLNVGCGFGIFDRLLPESWQLTGVDISEHEIKTAKEWASVHRPHWQYVTGALETLSFEPHSYDLILLSEVIEHVPSDALPSLFAMIHKLVNPTGHLLVSVPNKWTWRNRCRALCGQPLAVMDKTHLREYSLTEAKAELARFPFSTEFFKAAVAFFPLESYVRHVIPELSPIRKWLASWFPAASSHFIFLLRPNLISTE